MPKVPEKTTLQYLGNILRKTYRMKVFFCQQINIKVSSNWYYCFRCVWLGMSKLPKITSWLFLCNFLRKLVMKLILCMQISVKVYCKFIQKLLMMMVKHSKSSQNSKFAMFLQYLQKEVRDEVDFVRTDKHQSFL